MKVIKRFYYLVCLIAVLSGYTESYAQRWTVWYDVNYSNEMKGGPLKHWHFANGGVDCTFPVSRWDLTVGAGLNTTGGLLRINYAQLETNAGYRFVDTPGGFRLSALVGPYCGIRVADRQNDANSAGVTAGRRFVSGRIQAEERKSRLVTAQVLRPLAERSDS